jgi:hypothetical protein
MPIRARDSKGAPFLEARKVGLRDFLANITPEIKSGPQVSFSGRDCERVRKRAGGLWGRVEAGRGEGREGLGQGRVLNG